MGLEVGLWELRGGSWVLWDSIGCRKEDVGEFWASRMWARFCTFEHCGFYVHHERNMRNSTCCCSSEANQQRCMSYFVVLLIAWQRPRRKFKFKNLFNPTLESKKTQYRSTKFEERYMHELSKRQLACLLSIHEHIVADLLNILHH